MLKLTIDSLDGLDSSIQSLYEKTEAGSYMLKVDGIEDTTGLKTALQKEREQNKEAKSKLSEAEKRLMELEEAQLLESGKYKELSQKYQETATNAQAQLQALEREVATSKRDLMLRELANSMTTDPVEIDIITRFAVDFVDIEGRDVKFNKDEKEMKEVLSRFVRSKAHGTGDKGYKSGGESTSLKDAKSKADRKAIIEARIKNQG